MDNILVVLEIVARLNAALQQAAAENRDITDDEVSALRADNDSLIDDLLSR